MAPKCRKMAPRSFQEPSWPLLVALGPLLGLLRAILGRREAIWGASWAILGDLGTSWGELRPSGGDLGASWRDLQAILGVQMRMTPRGGGDVSAAGWPPLETFFESFFLPGTRNHYSYKKCSVGLTTRRAVLRRGRRIDFPKGDHRHPPAFFSCDCSRAV